jgi:hypothetical protein
VVAPHLKWALQLPRKRGVFSRSKRTDFLDAAARCLGVVLGFGLSLSAKFSNVISSPE